MGNKYEISAYEETPHGRYQYDYVVKYRGESFVKAIVTMLKLKKQGAKCIKLEWR